MKTVTLNFRDARDEKPDKNDEVLVLYYPKGSHHLLASNMTGRAVDINDKWCPMTEVESALYGEDTADEG